MNNSKHYGVIMAIIGLVPGAMKPYHAGHHYLVEQAMKECDRVIIFTTAKDRNGISGIKMAFAWTNLIIPLLQNVEVEFVISPIRAVWEFLIVSEHPSLLADCDELHSCEGQNEKNL